MLRQLALLSSSLLTSHTSGFVGRTVGRALASSPPSNPPRPALATMSSASATSASAAAAAVEDRPYGAWESPITSKAITAGSVRLGGLHYSDGELYW